MSSIKVLVTGAAGQYGGYIMNEFSKYFKVLGTYNTNKTNLLKDVNYVQLDITDFENTRKVIEEFEPDFLIHTASFSNPQFAELAPPKLVYLTNVLATENIAKVCETTDTRLIYISTDLVYAGYRGSVLKEDAKLIPASLYAETKLVAEQKIKENSSNYTILRNSLMYGIMHEINQSAFNKMYYSLKAGKSVRLFYDQFRSPLAFFDGARLLKELIQTIFCDNNIFENEIVNFGGIERISRAEMGNILCEEAGFDKSLLDFISLAEINDLPQIADVSINIDKLLNIGLIPLDVRSSVKKILKNI
ncbi:MAG: sugar nucleotide-binding protein [bacterium]